jgi:hypothetical protein
VSQPTTIAGAAVLAGLIVGGGAYTARHGVDGPALAASAAARGGLIRQAPSVPRAHLHRWKPVHVPQHPRTAAPPPAAAASAPIAVQAAVAAPVVVATASQPTTRTSPVASDDSGEGGGDD